MRKLFRKGYELTLNRVHDTIVIREGDETLKLSVNGDAQRMVAGINAATEKMKGITDSTTDEEAREVAEYFATVIFGREQARRVMDFYANDPGCVISVCSQYFTERLGNRIYNVQKNTKV